MAPSTKNYALRCATKMQKQLNTVAADLYGGANDVTLGTGNKKRMDLDAVSIVDATEKVVDTAVNGTQSQNYQETVARLPTFEIAGSMHTQGDVDLIVSSAGWEALDGPKAHDTGKYTHLILLDNRGREQRAYTAAESALITAGYDADDRINTYFHLAVDKGPSTEHAKNCVVKGFELGSQQKQPLKFKATGTAESLTRDASHTNVSSWTEASGAFLAHFMHYNAVFSLGTVGGSLTATQILEFNLKVNHGLAEGNIPTGTSVGGLAQAEPLSDGFTEVTVDFRVYKHDTDAYKGYETGDTFLSAKMVYTKGDKVFGIYLPNLQVVNAQDETGDGGSVMVSCRAFLPTAADPFTADRTISATEWVLPFTTPVYFIAKDSDQTNYMRVS